MAYTTIDDPKEYFNTVLYSGSSSTPLAVTGVGFQPDFTWLKSRSSAWTHGLFLKANGTGAGSGYKYLASSTTAAVADTWGTITFGSDGFTGVSSGYNGSFSHDFGAVNNTFVSWHWKANGGTTTSQTGSDINSVTEVNSDAKFSIVTYTGASGSDSANNGGAYWRVKHGLGSVPKFAIFKSTSNVHAWYVWHHKFPGASKSDGDHAVLNATAPMASDANILWGNTDWSTTEFEIGGWDVINGNNKNYVALLFDEVQGYSKFGSYVGNGNADGTFVYTGFKPAFVLLKSSTTSESWELMDNKRLEYNGGTGEVRANLNNAETTSNQFDLLSNGFKPRTTAGQWNTNNATYIYAAFAESPFVSSEGVPTTAK